MEHVAVILLALVIGFTFAVPPPPDAPPRYQPLRLKMTLELSAPEALRLVEAR